MNGRQPWTFIAATASYVDADGDALSDADVRDLLQRVLEVQRERAADATRRMIARESTLEEWEVELRWIVKDSFGMSYLLGAGGRNAMQMRDWGRLGVATSRAYSYLNNFANDLNTGSVSAAQALARAVMYPLGAKAPFARATAGTLGITLPVYPTEDCPCLTNCRCAWSIARSDRVIEATWVAVNDKNTCDTCRDRSRQWAPLVINIPQEVG